MAIHYYHMKREYRTMFRISFGYEEIGWCRRIGSIWVAHDNRVRVEGAEPQEAFDKFVRMHGGESRKVTKKKKAKAIVVEPELPFNSEDISGLLGMIRFRPHRRSMQ